MRTATNLTVWGLGIPFHLRRQRKMRWNSLLLTTLGGTWGPWMWSPGVRERAWDGS